VNPNRAATSQPVHTSLLFCLDGKRLTASPQKLEFIVAFTLADDWSLLHYHSSLFVVVFYFFPSVAYSFEHFNWWETCPEHISHAVLCERSMQQGTLSRHKVQINTSMFQCWEGKRQLQSSARWLCILINQQGGSRLRLPPHAVWSGPCDRLPGLCSVPCGNDSTGQNTVPHPSSRPNPRQESGNTRKRKAKRLPGMGRTSD